MTVEAIDAEFKPLAVRDEARLAPSSLFEAMRPAERIALATEIATALRGVLDAGKPGIDAQGKACKAPLITRVPQKVKGVLKGYSEHVHVEGWQTLATLCGVSARIVSTTKIANGYEAIAEVIRLENGVVVGGGEAICSKDEERGPWKYADEYAVKSMAQTRAISKALRGVLAWVIVLAGYNPTPADEVPPGGFNHDKPPALDPDELAEEYAKKSPPARPATIHATKAQTQELLDLSKSLGIEPLGEWIATHVAADFPDRSPRLLTRDEAAKAKALLEALIPSPGNDPDTGERMNPGQQGMMFALFSELGMNSPETRHAFAVRSGITLPEKDGEPTYSGLSKAAATTIIDALTKLADVLEDAR